MCMTSAWCDRACICLLLVQISSSQHMLDIVRLLPAWLQTECSVLADAPLQTLHRPGAASSTLVLGDRDSINWVSARRRHRFELSKLLPTDVAEEDRVGDSAAPAPAPTAKEEEGPGSDKVSVPDLHALVVGLGDPQHGVRKGCQNQQISVSGVRVNMPHVHCRMW